VWSAKTTRKCLLPVMMESNAVRHAVLMVAGAFRVAAKLVQTARQRWACASRACLTQLFQRCFNAPARSSTEDEAMSRKSGKIKPEMRPIVEGAKLSGAQRKTIMARVGTPGVRHTGGRGRPK